MVDLLKGTSPARLFARPTADAIWLGPAQQAALSHFSGAGFAKALIGPPSSGRSTILQFLSRELSDHVVMPVAGPKSDSRSVLASLLLAAELAPWELAESDQRNLLSVFIQQRWSQKRRVIIAIDDPHEFTLEAWDEIERLRAMQDRDRAAVELALFTATAGAAGSAQGEHPSTELIAGLKPQAVHALGPLSESEVNAYLQWRLAQFELEDLFTDTAVRLIARCTEGRFVAINVLGQMALLIARQRGDERVDARVVQDASEAFAKRRQTPHATPTVPEQPNDKGLPQAHLLITRDGAVISRVKLSERVLIGRSEHNDLCLPSPYLSRHHAAILGTAEGFYIVDLNSANGLMINKELTHRSVLYDQDVISVGPYRLKVEFRDEVSVGSPLPSQVSLADTAVMPAQPSARPNVRVLRG